MKKLLSLAAAALGSLLFSSSGQAAFNPALVSGDATWAVYADLNALRTGPLGQHLIDVISQAKFQTAAGEIGIDPQKALATVSSVTAWGTSFSADPKKIDGALIAQGTPELRKIAEGLLLQINVAHPDKVIIPDHRQNDHTFSEYVLNDEHKNPDGSVTINQVFIAFPVEPLVIVSKSQEQLLKAYNVFRGNVPSLAANAASPLKKFLASSADATVFAVSQVPPDSTFGDAGPQGRILKMTRASAVAIGERESNTFAHAELLAASGDDADRLVKILQGMSAMLSLATTNNNQLTTFLNSISTTRNGDTVTLDASYPSAGLVEIFKNIQSQAIAPAMGNGGHPAPASLLINGTAIAEWQAVVAPAPAAGTTPALATHTAENVPLKTGSVITLGRASMGGESVRFDRIEITPSGGGAPLVFRSSFMRQAGPRGNWSLLEFPGADGTYTLKVSYTNDPTGKAKFAISVRDPKA